MTHRGKTVLVKVYDFCVIPYSVPQRVECPECKTTFSTRILLFKS